MLVSPPSSEGGLIEAIQGVDIRPRRKQGSPPSSEGGLIEASLDDDGIYTILEALRPPLRAASLKLSGGKLKLRCLGSLRPPLRAASLKPWCVVLCGVVGVVLSALL